jgi:hypothetical protein
MLNLLSPWIFTVVRRSRRDPLAALASSLVVLAAIGCNSAQAPLAIHMYNPKTHQALTCSARDEYHRTDVSLLAGAVESCAKNLEAQGFVREK